MAGSSGTLHRPTHTAYQRLSSCCGSFRSCGSCRCTTWKRRDEARRSFLFRGFLGRFAVLVENQFVNDDGV